eukprot:5671800-Alexandrium_andersonii.AAC.1
MERAEQERRCVPPEEQTPAFRNANLVLPALPEEDKWRPTTASDADPDLHFAEQRAWLLARIFALLDRDGDGRLNCPESLALAQLCGDTTPLEEWPHQYRLL